MAAHKKVVKKLDTIWECPDDLWENVVVPVLEALDPPVNNGRPRIDPRRALNGIIHQMRSGCQWNHLPREFGDDSSVHRTFQRWTDKGVLTEIWAVLVGHCQGLGDVDWEWQSADGFMGKARKGGDLVGPNPTDRAKNGTKRSLIVDAKGGILSVTLDGANRHDAKMLAATVADMIVGRPEPEEGPQNLCLDKGYDNPSGETAALEAGYVTHIRRIGEEKLDAKKKKTRKARRWVVERAGAWLNGCRAILVRWNKKSSNYLGLIQLAISLLWYRRAVQLGPLTIQDGVLR